MINIHLMIASLYMPLMLMMPFTGAMYILGFQGSQSSTEIFRSRENPPVTEPEKIEFFRNLFKQQNVDYDFQYIKTNKNDFIFRPQSTVHFTAVKSADGELIFSRNEPNLMRRLIELHKGHGPEAMRWFEVSFGIALILTTLSGLYLAWTVKPYRRITLVSFAVGAVAIGLCLI